MDCAPNTLDAASFGPFSLSVSVLFSFLSFFSLLLLIFCSCFLLPNSPEGYMLLRVREGAPQGWAALVLTAEPSVMRQIREACVWTRSPIEASQSRRWPAVLGMAAREEREATVKDPHTAVYTDAGSCLQPGWAGLFPPAPSWAPLTHSLKTGKYLCTHNLCRWLRSI